MKNILSVVNYTWDILIRLIIPQWCLNTQLIEMTTEEKKLDSKLNFYIACML